MIVRIVNPWTFSGFSYRIGDIIEMPEDLFAHVLPVSVAEKIASQPARVYLALSTGQRPTKLLAESLQFTEDQDRFFFRLPDDSKQYSVPKDKKVREIV